MSEVLNMIRESCPVGAFVKYEKGRWYDLDDTVCREKVGSLCELRTSQIEFVTNLRVMSIN